MDTMVLLAQGFIGMFNKGGETFVGWVSGIIEFDGNVWTLVDPTFGANTDNKTLKKFIGDGSNYILQKMY